MNFVGLCAKKPAQNWKALFTGAVVLLCIVSAFLLMYITYNINYLFLCVYEWNLGALDKNLHKSIFTERMVKH